MSSKNNDKIISIASPHTIKKFDLIEKYVIAWSQKLLNGNFCDKLVFIDCMSNSGEYTDKDGNTVFGTPYRVAKILRDTAGQYPDKKIHLIYNDLNENKIAHLQSILPKDKSNFHIKLKCGDGNDLLKNLGNYLNRLTKTHVLLVYDPYDASIDWEAILPFLNTWGEVIINHQVSDTVRSIGVVKKTDKLKKYEDTYQEPIEKLIPYGTDRNAYEERIENIIQSLHFKTNRKYYIAAFPFFNQKNSVVYNLIHCTGHIVGFNLFKQTAWQTFGDKSSEKNTHGKENQLTLDLSGNNSPKTTIDEDCYFVKDIADYLCTVFENRNDVTKNEMWTLLEQHPVFPTDGFKLKITRELKNIYGISLKKGVYDFTIRR